MSQATNEVIDHEASEKRVLIVEDDSLMRTAYRMALSRAGYAVEVAREAKVALERLTTPGEPNIALVVLDIGLPDMSGLELLAAIRETYEERILPVIVVTGADGLDDRLRGLEGGANDYLVKPVALPELVARVNAQLHLIARWRARMSDVRGTRRRIALDLRGITKAEDTPEAMKLVLLAAEQLADAAGAAFITGGDRLRVETAVGDVPFTPGSEIPEALAAKMRAARGIEPFVASCGGSGFFSGPSQVAVVPLVVADRTAGFITVAFTAELIAERVEALVVATADLAEMAAPQITRLVNHERSTAERQRHYRQLIETQAFSTVFQPIVDLKSGCAVGFEALTRFADGTRPDIAFAAAGDVGEGAVLEKAAGLLAIERAKVLPADAYVSVNFSAHTLLDVEFLATLASTRREVMIEITEHDAVEDYAQLHDALATVRHHARIAADDTGAGYAGLHHVRCLRPDVIKLDRSLVSALGGDAVGRAMVAGMVYFAAETGTAIVAEGVETQRELQALIDLGVSHGQGYLLGKPSPAGRWV